MMYNDYFKNVTLQIPIMFYQIIKLTSVNVRLDFVDKDMHVLNIIIVEIREEIQENTSIG